MNTAQLIVSLLLALVEHLQQISSIIATAGDKPLTADQWSQLVDADSKARAALSKVIFGAVTPPAPPPAA